jgi:hypothetical protein
MAEAHGRAMRPDRPPAPEQPGFACGLGFSGSLQLGAAARYTLRLTKGKRKGSFSRADRAHLGNVGFYLLRTGCPWRLLPKEFPS